MSHYALQGWWNKHCFFSLCSLFIILLQVAHHYPTIQHLTQTHPHAWLPRRVGTHLKFFMFYPNVYLCMSMWVDVCDLYRWSELRMSNYRKIKRIMEEKTLLFPAPDKQIHSEHTHLRAQSTHSNPKHMQSPNAPCKALRRCTFCVVKNNMSQAATTDRAIQGHYLNAVTTHRGSERTASERRQINRKTKAMC